MTQTLKLKRSAVAGRAPTTSDLELGELAINTTDGKLYIKKSVSGTESIVALSASQAGELQTQQFSGDGSTTAFTLSATPNDENALLVFIGGAYQNKDSYAISGTTLTFDTAPDNGTDILVHHFRGGLIGTAPAIDTMTGDGSDTTLTLSVSPQSENQTFVTIDGVVQHKDTYSVSGTTLTFASAPSNSAKVECITFRNTVVTTFEDGDGDTMIQVEESSDEDTIRFDTAGSQRLSILSTGVTKIEGTNSLQFNTNGSIKYSSSPSSIIFSNASSEDIHIKTVANASAGEIQFSVNNSETARIVDGAVLIGTNSSLHSSADLQIQGASSNFARIMLKDQDGTTQHAFIDKSGADLTLISQNGTSHGTVSLKTFDGTDTLARLTVAADGNIGIGTTSPSEKLHVKDSSEFLVDLNGSDSAAIFKESGGNSWRIGNDSSADAFAITQSESSLGTDVRLYIANGGNVGIGTTSPSYKTEIVGGGNYSQLRLASSVSDNTTKYSALTFEQYDVDEEGFLGLGGFSSSSENAVIVGGGTGSFNAATRVSFITAANGTTTTGSERMRIDSSGNVGIGTTSPNHTLDIVGTNGVEITTAETTDAIALLDSNNSNTKYLSIQGDNGDCNINTPAGDLSLQRAGTTRLSVGTAGITVTGNITSSGNIDVNSDSGQLQFGADNDMQMFHNGAQGEINIATGDFLVDSVGDITLDAAGNDWKFDSQGGNKLKITNSSGDVVLTVGQQDKDLIFKGDDGGSTITALTLDMSASGAATFNDQVTIGSGSNLVNAGNMTIDVGGDLTLDADGADIFLSDGGTNFGLLANTSSNFVIMSRVDDKDIIFKGLDNSSTITALTLDMSDAGTAIFNHDVQLNADNSTLKIGAGLDLQLLHDGTNSIIKNADTGNLIIRNTVDDGDVIFSSDDGSGGVTTYFQLDGSEVVTSFLKTTRHLDSVKAMFGSSNDLQIYHDGSNSYIDDSGTGNLLIRGSEVVLGNDAKKGVRVIADGGVQIRHNDTTKIETTSAGATLTGDLTTTGGITVGDSSADALTFFGILKQGGSGGTTVIDASRNLTNINDATVGGNLTVTGNLTVDGTTTTLNTATLDVEDKNITLNKGSGDTSGSADGAGITIQDAVDASNDATILWNASADRFDFSHGLRINADDQVLTVGAGGDFAVSHNGTDTFMANNTGHLYITQTVDDKDLIFRCDDGSGGVTEYFRLDGADARVIYTKPIRMLDSNNLQIGTGGDMQLYHNGTDNYIEGQNGDVIIRNLADDKDILIQTDDGSGSVTTYMQFDGSDTRIKTSKNLRVADDVYITFGNSDDLQIRHDATDSTIINNTGNLTIKNETDDGDIILSSDDGSGGTGEYIRLDGSAAKTLFSKDIRFSDSVKALFGGSDDLKIYHGGTDSFVQNHTGNLKIINYADDSDIVMQTDDGSGGVTTYMTFDGSATKVTLQKDLRADDGVKIQAGSSGDLFMVHESDTSKITNGTGNLEITQNVDDGDIIFKSDDGSGGVATYLTLDGSTTTMAAGKNLTFADNVKAVFGTGSDLEIYHDASHSYVIHGGSGQLVLESTADDIVIRAADDVDIKVQGGETAAKFGGNGGVDLYHNNVKKFSTDANGIVTVGTVSVNSAYTLPTSDGSNGQALVTDGSGTLSFGTVSGGSSTSIADADADTKIQVEESSDEDKIRFDTAGTERVVIDAAGISSSVPLKKSGTGTAMTVNALDFIDYNSGFRVGSIADDDESLTLIGFGGTPKIVLDDGTNVTIFQGSTECARIGSTRSLFGTTTATGKFGINTGTSGGVNASASTQANGSVIFGNTDSSSVVPAIMMKGDGGRTQFRAATANGANFDIEFNIRENDDSDYASTGGAGFLFSRYGTDLLQITRHGNVDIGFSSGVGTGDGNPALRATQSSTSFNGNLLQLQAKRPSSSAYSLIQAYANFASDPKFKVRGDGEVSADGSFSGGGADYAEYFEWSDGNSSDEDRIGYSVSLVNEKIKIAESGETIIGVTSANPSVTGDSQDLDWQGKYLKDDFGRYVEEDYTATEWTKETSDNSDTPKREKVLYHTDKIPSDVTVPENAVVLTKDENGNNLRRRKLNPSYDESLTYIPRRDRKEWECVGIMGKVKLRKGQQTAASWIKLRKISETVEEWLIK